MHWGDALGRNSEQSPRTIMVWVGVEIVRGSSPHSSTWVLWYGANSSSPRSDAYQGKFPGLINVGMGLSTHQVLDSYIIRARDMKLVKLMGFRLPENGVVRALHFCV